MTSSAALLLASCPLYPSFTYRSPRLEYGLRSLQKASPVRNQPSIAVRCSSASYEVAEPAVERRSANYRDCVWDYDYIQFSMGNEYMDVKYKMLAEELKLRVGIMLNCVSDWGEQLDLIDDLQRLGVDYHFDEEIKTMLNEIYSKNYVHEKHWVQTDLHTTALAFRLLRQNGYPVPQDIFRFFLDERGRFRSSLCADIKGLISLYEASYLATEGETIMEEALTFTITNLSKINKVEDMYLDVLLIRAMDMPLQWRTARSEARWFAEEAYERKPNMSSLMLNFAKLDYNIVQGMYREELRDLSRWWTNLGFEKHLSFARDCLVVSYVWGIMASSKPQYEACRKAFAKMVALVTTVDDVYDVYGTLEELELFTDAFERWDIDAMKQLPTYMKLCYLACYNCVNEMVYSVLNEKGSNVTPNLKNAWAILARAYMKEARWFHSGHKPTLEEYMSNARFTIATHLVSIHGHIFDTQPFVGTQVQYLESHPELLKWSCVTFRLCDDLGTSTDEMARGDTPKAIQCHMNDTGCSEQAARDHVKVLVREGWKKMNKYKLEETTLDAAGAERLIDLVRASMCFYQHGDGHGIQDGETKQLMSKLLFDPIPL